MTYEEKRQRNDAMFREWFEATLKGEKAVKKRLAEKYNLNPLTVQRGIEEAKKRNSVEINIRPLC
jgi:DNA-binding transcriptional regulator LsrR (DeoR family)